MILNEELDPTIAFGFTGGPEFLTRITSLRNGHERRNAEWSQTKHRYTAPFNNISDPEYREIKRMFMVCRGQLHGFLLKDWLDFEAVDEPFGTGNGSTAAFQLVKVSEADGATYQRTISRPLSVAVKANDVAATGTVDPDTGIFTFDAAPADGAVLTWSGEFRIPVRFASDWLPFSIDNRRGPDYAVNGSVELVEVFGE
jgi:uncharacterized protein (TIGR02217 family)